MKRLGALVNAALLVIALLTFAAPLAAQTSRETQRKLDRTKRELDKVAAERRHSEGQRGVATRRLREVDERVGASTRALQQTESDLKRQQTELKALTARRDALAGTLGAQRKELAKLLRAAYAVGGAAPLKLMLSQDTVAEGNRLLAYHGYLQRARARRLAELRAELAGLREVEKRIATASVQLKATQQEQRNELARLERDRKQRTATLAELDKQYQDRRTREKALGRDVKQLQSLLAQLRAAARRAEAERRASRRNSGDDGSSLASSGSRSSRSRRPPAPTIANAQPIRVGGLGWPVSGTLLASYGGTLPDGRRSQGVLIGAPAGSTVQAVANGKVVFSEWMSGYGLLCIVDHGNGTMSLYANNDGLLRDAGSDVKRGDAIANVGNSGGQGVPALYFELRRNGQPVDPRSWLQKR